ncbi:MAG: hypothetical protein JSU70_07990 [Phycisphaerales bacterium]|nr:MAG: hypothetical protein JSU70_07990 [Phycisphaerales bacterium]
MSTVRLVTVCLAAYLMFHCAEAHVANAVDMSQASVGAIGGPLPDLIVTEVTAPDEVIIGEEFTVSWTVKNQGKNMAYQPWMDRAYLAQNDPLEDPGILLATHQNEETLGPLQSYRVSLTTVVTPGTRSGAYYLVVRTDAGQAIPEADEDNNILAKLIDVGLQLRFTVTPTSDPNGSIHPDSPFTILRGFDQRFSATPDISYGVDTWYVDGLAVQTGGTKYLLSNIQADHAVHVTFKPVLGYTLKKYTFEDDEEFNEQITNNNFIAPDPNMSRIHVERTVDPELDPGGMMLLRNLTSDDPSDPDYGQVIYARAKAEFPLTGASEMLIRFEYLFSSSEPGTALLVYLSNVPDLLDHDDPASQEYEVLVAELPAPPPDRPGGAGSGRFGIFEKTVPTDILDFTSGCYMELELVEPELLQASTILAAPGLGFAAASSGGASAAVDSWGPEVHCDGICLDITWDNFVSEADFLTVVGECGSTAELGGGSGSRVCLEGAFSDDGFVDPLDVAGWDWTLGSDDRKNLCKGVPLTGDTEFAGFKAADAKISAGPMLFADAPEELSDVLIVGKRDALGVTAKLEDRLYVFDRHGQYVRWFAPSPDRYNVRLVRGPDGQIYQVNTASGVVRLDATDEALVPPGQTTFASEPRYGKFATVYVGIQGEGSDSFGRPILDAAFDRNYVYVAPVVVSPDGAEAYAVAAKLRLLDSGSPPYQVVQLYDDPPPPADNQYRNALREIEVDTDGNVYVINAHNLNESDILWRYYPDGSSERVDLGREDSDTYIPDPVAMYLSDPTNMLYLASGQYNPTDFNVTIVHGFSIDGALAAERSITIEGMQHVTDITEDPTTGHLLVVGFGMEDIPAYPNPTRYPFYFPCLAEVPYGSDSVQAQILEGSHDLALPMSIVWTATAKCGGADMDLNGSVGYADLAILAERWLDSGCYPPNWCAGADVDKSQRADVADLAILTQYWLDSGCLD